MQLKDIYIRDPFILCDSGVFYMYGKQYLEQRGFVVYKSEDLKEWSEPENVFMPDEAFWADRDFWAPEVHYYMGRFYMIATFKSETRARGSQILVSDSPDGKFVPLTPFPITPENWEALDGTLYIDKCGNPHIVFCHEWQQGGNGSVCEMPLSDDLSKAIGEPRVLWYAGDCSKAVSAFSHTKALVTDGPFLHRLQNGRLICIWSTFTEKGYSMLVAESDNGDIDGNWLLDDETLLDIDGGHGMIFDGGEQGMKFVMHSPNIDGLERARIYNLTEEDGSIKLSKN